MPELLFEKRGTTLLPAASGGVSASVFIMTTEEILEKVNGIQVHRYGAHIFHTSDKEVWEYVNEFAEFNNYINSPIARYHNELYNLPFNMNTFSKM